MTLLVVLLPGLVLLLCFTLASAFGGRFGTGWWLLRLGLVPLLGFGLAGYVMAFPTPIPHDYDPMIHPNGGRLDFAAIMFWGLAVPLAWFVLALPATLAYAAWKHRR